MRHKSQGRGDVDFDDWLDKVPNLTAPEPRRPKPSSLYPHLLKVHIRSMENCQKLAALIQRPLEHGKELVFTEKSRFKSDKWIFVGPKRPPRIRKIHDAQENYWQGMPDFENQRIPRFTFKLVFRTAKAYAAFARLVKQKLSTDTKAIWYPSATPQITKKKHWVSRAKYQNPRYPIYIISKGRGDTRLTSNALERIGVPYKIVIEPQEYDEYSCVIDEDRILVANFSNHGKGSGPARNFAWDHARTIGAKRHWVLDDNIKQFYRLHENKRIAVADGAIFRAAEDFVDRFSNVPLAGFHYDFFVPASEHQPPFVFNSRIFSCLLIDTTCPHRWRGRYNEDVDLSLRVMKDNKCTILFYAFLAGKAATQSMGGGNTAEFYAEEGTLRKSRMLKAMHPDCVEVVWRYNRWHHHVTYGNLKENRPRLRKTKVSRSRTNDPYSMILVPD